MKSVLERAAMTNPSRTEAVGPARPARGPEGIDLRSGNSNFP